MYKICSKLTINTPERRHGRRSCVFLVNFAHTSVSFIDFENRWFSYDFGTNSSCLLTIFVMNHRYMAESSIGLCIQLSL